MSKISWVVIIKGSNPTEITVKALETIKSDLESVLSSDKPILVKPNYITAQHPSTGVTTDSRVVEGVIKFLKEHGKNDIIVGEGSGAARAGEGHETSGNPVKMDLVIAGTDPVAVDAVGAAVMGVSPTEVEHLVLAEKKGLGTCQLENIEVVGEPIERVRRNFRRSISSKILKYF